MNQGVKFKAEIIMLHLDSHRHIKQHLGPFANRKLAEEAAGRFIEQEAAKGWKFGSLHLIPAEINEQMFRAYQDMAVRTGNPKLKSRALPLQFEETAEKAAKQEEQA